jgi:hypothetical protein
MLYIENIDSCTFKMWGTNVSQTGVKILGKEGLAAKGQEPAYNETTGRISIYNFQKDEKLLNHKPVSEIVLQGVIYATAQAFVSAFNALMAECCCGGGGSIDVDVIVDAIEALGDRIVASNCCNECNDWSIEEVESGSVTFPANTLNSITIIIESGTVNISNGTDDADLIEGETVTYTASQLLAEEVIVDATDGRAICAVLRCTPVTTTTTTGTPGTTTTTTTVYCDSQEIGTGIPLIIYDFPSKGGGVN